VAAQPAWARLSAEDRGGVLAAIGAAISDDAAELIEIERAATGKLRRQVAVGTQDLLDRYGIPAQDLEKK
jgi:acyl-CoA reductase-like NAD-dependent aldehyde dehydrogenase